MNSAPPCSFHHAKATIGLGGAGGGGGRGGPAVPFGKHGAGTGPEQFTRKTATALKPPQVATGDVLVRLPEQGIAQ
jgi:hypothetical protein